jgi:phosphatidylethanolamine/phosphatidyl-N-methylethanolamine N-methyltransferase
MEGQKFDSVVSAVPLLNFPMQARIAMLESVLDRLPPAAHSSRFPMASVSPIIARPDRYHIQHFDFIVRNIPPAHLWIYRRG